MAKELVARWFNKIMPSEHNMPLLIVNGIAYTPQETYNEVMRGTPIGDQLQRLLETGKFGTATMDEQALVLMRARRELQGKPQDKPLWGVLPTSGLKTQLITPAQMLREIENPDSKLGKQYLTYEASFMRRILAVR